jgi:penicillin-binding protein 1C
MRRLRSVFRLLALATSFLLVAFGALWFCLPKPPSPLHSIGFSQCVYDRNGRLLRVGLTSDDKYRLRTPLSAISSELIAATLLHEDQHFWHHPGVNPIATLRASWHFCLGHSGRGGASTITMQLARMRLGMRTRSPAGKLRQMIFALELERHYSKNEILEAYLNLAPYGGNVEGIGAASLLYFGKAPGKLTLHEAVSLSVIPQSPTRRTPRSIASAALVAAKDRIYTKLGRGESGSDFAARAEAKRVFAAPHFVLRLPSEQTACTTTLDLDLQRTIERRITEYIAARREVGVQNAAAMLIDTRRMEVLAEIGSADFFNSEISGQVDGTRSRRSPGSALKPFIFALAIDQGLIHPLSMLKDAPQSFHGYNPENFDGDFVGPIKAGEALARSRNVPAVALAAQLAHPTFYEFLKRSGVALPRDENYYGLSLPLGGAEVTMEEIVRLYAMLANGGRLRTLHRTLPHADLEQGARLLSPEAAYLALEMIRDISPPGSSPVPGDAGVYWKTGTSHGFRDAWSVAVFDHYVLAVWVGNFDGQRNPAFVGRTCAAPLLFRVINALRVEGRVRLDPRDPPRDANLQHIEFCAVSGQIPTAACAHRITGWFIPGVSPIQPCEVHREILVDVVTGLRVSVDDGTRKLRREVYEFWPSDLLALFAQAGLPRRGPPPFLPGWETGAAIEMIGRTGKPPEIVSPAPNGVYALGAGDDSHRTLSLKAQADADVRKVYWFADKSFLGAASPRETVRWQPGPGVYKLVALDDRGRSSTRLVTLQAADANHE